MAEPQDEAEGEEEAEEVMVAQDTRLISTSEASPSNMNLQLLILGIAMYGVCGNQWGRSDSYSGLQTKIAHAEVSVLTFLL